MTMTWAMGFFLVPQCRLFDPSMKQSLNFPYGGW
jgi:hypothetical protein